MRAITDFVSLEANGNVGVVTVDNPPVNALSVGVRTGIKEGIEAAASDAGADITEFGKPLQPLFRKAATHEKIRRG